MNAISKFFRLSTIILAGIVVLWILTFEINYNDLSWDANRANYLIVFAQIIILLSNVMAYREVINNQKHV
jgi:hypothetical protein